MVAFEMIQRTNPSHEFTAFDALQKKLDIAMEILINSKKFTIFYNLILIEYYSGFNNAVTIFGGIVERVQGSNFSFISLNLLLLLLFKILRMKFANYYKKLVLLRIRFNISVSIYLNCMTRLVHTKNLLN